jgi:hypothetical protein
MNLRILATLLLLAACSKPVPATTGPASSDPATSSPGTAGAVTPEPTTPEPTTPEPTSGKTQIANPASEHCVKQGGTLEIAKTPQGEQGICVLPGGVRCDEWAYFRKQCP